MYNTKILTAIWRHTSHW